MAQRLKSVGNMNTFKLGTGAIGYKLEDPLGILLSFEEYDRSVVAVR